MDTRTGTGTPLRQRMIDDMRMRKMAEHTQDGYIRAVRRLAMFLGRSPDTATVEDLRRFQMHLVDAGSSPITINATLSGVKILLQSDAQSRRGPGQGASRSRAANPASGSQS